MYCPSRKPHIFYDTAPEHCVSTSCFLFWFGIFRKKVLLCCYRGSFDLESKVPTATCSSLFFHQNSETWKEHLFRLSICWRQWVLLTEGKNSPWEVYTSTTTGITLPCASLTLCRLDSPTTFTLTVFIPVNSFTKMFPLRYTPVWIVRLPDLVHTVSRDITNHISNSLKRADDPQWICIFVGTRWCFKTQFGFQFERHTPNGCQQT